MAHTVHLDDEDVSEDFTCTKNDDGSYELEGQPPIGSVAKMDDFNEQTVTVDGKPARQVVCSSLNGSPPQYTVKATVLV